MIRLRSATRPEDIEAVRGLLREYVAGLGVDLSFQDFEAEVAGLPGAYAPPRGRLIVAHDARRPSASSGRGGRSRR